jgi:hypothetical protein
VLHPDLDRLRIKKSKNIRIKKYKKYRSVPSSPKLGGFFRTWNSPSQRPLENIMHFLRQRLNFSSSKIFFQNHGMDRRPLTKPDPDPQHC